MSCRQGQNSPNPGCHVKAHCFPIPNHYSSIEEAPPESVDSEDADLCNAFLVPMSWSRFSCCLERKFGIWFKSKKYNTAGRYSTGRHHFYQNANFLPGTATLSLASTSNLIHVLYRENCQISNSNPFLINRCLPNFVLSAKPQCWKKKITRSLTYKRERLLEWRSSTLVI